MERLEACKNYYSKTDIAPDNEKLEWKTEKKLHDEYVSQFSFRSVAVDV